MSDQWDVTQLEKLESAALIALILRQQAPMKLLTEQVQALQDQLAKDSGNSSKPPSSEGLKKPRTKSLREKGKRASGGPGRRNGEAGCRSEAVVAGLQHGGADRPG